MSKDTTVTEQATAAAATEAPINDVGSRASAMVERMRSERTAPEVAESSDEATAIADATEDKLGTQEPVTKDPKTERAERLEAMRAKAKDEQERRTRHAAAEQERQQASRAQQENAALKEQLNALRTIERDIKDPAKFLEYAQRAGVPPEQLGAYISESISDPATHAEKRAREAISPELKELREHLARAEARIESFVAEQAKGQQTARQRADEQMFVGHIKSAAADAPLTHNYLREVGEERFIREADAVARGLPPGIGLQGLIDHIENALESQVAILGRLTSSGTGSGTSPSQANPRSHATAPANTLSNRAAQGRSSITEEAEDWQLPVGERAERLKRKLGAR